MHGETLPRWLKDKGMRENLKGKEEVASRLDDEKARSKCIIRKGQSALLGEVG